MSGKSAGLSVDGASESMANAGRNLPASMKDAGGGASSGGSAPAPGAPGKASEGGSGSGGGGDSAGGGSAGGEGDEKAKSSEDNPDAAASEEEDTGDEEKFAEASADMLETIMVEKRNGAGMKYLAGHEQDATVKPLLAELSHEAVAVEPGDKPDNYPTRTTRSDSSDTADPAELDDLSQDRAAAVKTEIHVFLARVERTYGQMTDIEQTRCAYTPKVCTDNGISGSYLTMTAGQRAKLSFGLKYVNNKWRRYVIGFTK